VPWFAPVLFVAKMAGGMEDAAITAGRIGASSSAVITFDPEKAAGATSITASPGQTTIPQDFEPGRFWRLGPGEGLTQLPCEYPSEAYGPFIQNMRRSQSMGLNVAYSQLTGDLSSVNFSSIRAGILTERDSWRQIQHWLITHMHRRVFRAWALEAAVNGVISASDAKAAIAAQTWKPRGWRWVQPVDEVNANSMAVDQLFTTRSEIAAEQGLDFEDIVARQVEEEKMIVAAGLTVPGVSLGPIDTNQNQDGEKESAPQRQLRLARSR
jgi:lambda family phage portal protein